MRFGTVGAPSSTPAKPGGSVGAIQRLSELGLDSLELGWVQAVRVSEETCAVIRKTAIDKKVAISVHAPYFINLNANDEEWPKSRKRLWDAALYGSLAGATDIIFHPGSYFGEAPGKVLETVLPRLRNLVEELVENRIDVTLRPETMGKQAMIGSLQDTLVMSRSMERVLPCMDFAHLFARPGDGSINRQDDWESILIEYRNELGMESLQHLHIHLSGIEYGPKGEKNHLPARESALDVAGLFRALRKFQCDGRILCESPILEEDALYFKEIWELQS